MWPCKGLRPPSPAPRQRIQRTDGGGGEGANDVRVDHGCFQTSVAKILLHLPDVHPAAGKMAIIHQVPAFQIGLNIMEINNLRVIHN